MVPAALATMANTPIGVNLETNCVTLAIARFRTVRLSSRPCFDSMPIKAMPTATLNRTTAGTMLLARAWKGLAGMKRLRKLTVSGVWTKEILKNEADSNSGKARGMARIAAKASNHENNCKPPTLRAKILTSWYLRCPRPVMRDRVI